MRVLVIGEDAEEDQPEDADADADTGASASASASADMDTATRRICAAHLRRDGHAVDEVASLGAALRAVADVDYDCVVVVAFESGPQAATFVTGVRQQRPSRPVLAILDEGAAKRRVEVLEVGVDDLLAPPVSLDELAVRVRKLIVRGASPRPDRGYQHVGRLALHRDRREVLLDGEPVALPRIQYALLECLVRNQGQIVSADELLRTGWDRNQVFGVSPLPAQMSRLRKRLRGAVRIDVIRESGYRIRVQTDGSPPAP